MIESVKPNVLINLPSGFFRTPLLKSRFDALEAIANVRTTSHDVSEAIELDLIWADAVIMWAWPELTDEMLERAERLRYVGFVNATQSTVRALFRRGVAVSEARHAWSPAVAELALGLILNGLRKISSYHMTMKAGTETWIEDFPFDIDPDERELAGQAVGIIGFGGVGQRLAQLLQPFGVKLSVYDPYIAESDDSDAHCTIQFNPSFFE